MTDLEWFDKHVLKAFGIPGDVGHAGAIRRALELAADPVYVWQPIETAPRDGHEILILTKARFLFLLNGVQTAA